MAVEVGTVCSVTDCTTSHYGLGYCYKHYLRMRRHGTLTLPKRKRVRPVCSARGHTDADFVTGPNGRRYCAACDHYNTRKGRLRRRGLSLEEFDRMVEDQGGACAICRRVPDHVLRVDHNHETGTVRGLLCHSCNVAMGLLGDDTERLIRAITYLGVTQWP